MRHSIRGDAEASSLVGDRGLRTDLLALPADPHLPLPEAGSDLGNKTMGNAVPELPESEPSECCKSISVLEFRGRGNEF